MKKDKVPSTKNQSYEPDVIEKNLYTLLSKEYLWNGNMKKNLRKNWHTAVGQKADSGHGKYKAKYLLMPFSDVWFCINKKEDTKQCQTMIWQKYMPL